MRADRRHTDSAQLASSRHADSADSTQMASQSVGTGQTTVQWRGGRGVGESVGDEGSEKSEVQGRHVSAPA